MPETSTSIAPTPEPPAEPAVPHSLQPAVPAEPPDPDDLATAQASVQSPPPRVLVQGTAAFENCPHGQLQQDDVDALHRFLTSEDHLRSNIVNVTLDNLSSRSFRTNLFTHTVGVNIIVATERLWEPPESYLRKHLGKSEWERSNGTIIKLSRIHAK